MRNPSLLLISILLSLQLSSAIPVPSPVNELEQLESLGNTLKTASGALQSTTKSLSTSMAGGLGGMGGAAAAIPKFQKRQKSESLDLNLAGVKPGDVMKTLQDPTAALKNLPIPVEGLAKRLLGSLGGLTGILGGLPGLSQSPSPPPPSSASQAKDRGKDSKVNQDDEESESELSKLEAALDGTPPPPPVDYPKNDTGVAVQPTPINTFESTTISSSSAAESTPSTSEIEAQAQAQAESEVQAATAKASSDITPEVPPDSTTGTEESEPESVPETKAVSTPNINTVTNSQSGNKGTDTATTPTDPKPSIVKRFLNRFMPKPVMSGDLSGEGWRDPKLVLKELGATDAVKSVIDAPGITGLKEKREEKMEKREAVVDPFDPLGKLESVSKTLNSAEAVLKAVPLAQGATA